MEERRKPNTYRRTIIEPLQAVQPPQVTPTPQAQPAPTRTPHTQRRYTRVFETPQALQPPQVMPTPQAQPAPTWTLQQGGTIDIVPQATQTPSPQSTPKEQILSSNANSPLSKTEKEALSEQLDRLNIENAKLSALYLRLKIGLLVAAVALIILLLGTQTSNLSAEKFLEWLFPILGGF